MEAGQSLGEVLQEVGPFAAEEAHTGEEPGLLETGHTGWTEGGLEDWVSGLGRNAVLRARVRICQLGPRRQEGGYTGMAPEERSADSKETPSQHSALGEGVHTGLWSWTTLKTVCSGAADQQAKRCCEEEVQIPWAVEGAVLAHFAGKAQSAEATAY